jgi:hypothetical protein
MENLQETTVQEAQVVTPTYDPNKKYSWTPQDQFMLSGGEFGLILNAFRSVLNTKEAATILMANQANTVIEEILAKAVESGMVKEAPEEQQ